MIPASRHPKINYWFWYDRTVEGKSYLQTLERIKKHSRFDTITLTDRGCDFFDPIHKEDFRTLVTHAHELGLKIILQLWTPGYAPGDGDSTIFIDSQEAAAIALDVETTVRNGKAHVRSVDKWTRPENSAASVDSEFLCAYVFKKTADGYYEDGTLVDVTDRLQTVYRTPDRISAVIDVPEFEGCTVFAVAAHYHRTPDAYSDRIIAEYKRVMDYYADVPFDGIALDEFRTLTSATCSTIDEPFRGRMYGKAFDRTFCEKTGKDLKRILFDMRYCPVGKDEVRASAINLYFDNWRRSVVRVEDFICDYSEEVFGKDVFHGFHNTFHNALEIDEVWNTGCAWWEIKREYAQTDENMAFPVRLGLACQAKEALHYDMFYHKDKDVFFEKCLREAAFGTRIHYHAIEDGSVWGTDTGTEEFLTESKKYEDHVELLNLFEPVMPTMPLLSVFGFPAQLNWYPDESRRAQFDVTEGLHIIEKTQALWEAGYLNALAPDDAIADGRIRLLDDGTFDYCGHNFGAMLFFYPEYSKPSTVAFLRAAIEKGANIRVIGALTHGFDGLPCDGTFLATVTVEDPMDAVRAFSLAKNDIAHGCRLTDGSVVISHYESVRDGVPYTANFTLDGAQFEATFIGSFAIRTDGCGNVMRLVCGSLTELTKDGIAVLPDLRGEAVCFGI